MSILTKVFTNGKNCEDTVDNRGPIFNFHSEWQKLPVPLLHTELGRSVESHDVHIPNISKDDRKIKTLLGSLFCINSSVSYKSGSPNVHKVALYKPTTNYNIVKLCCICI